MARHLLDDPTDQLMRAKKEEREALRKGGKLENAQGGSSSDRDKKRENSVCQ